MSELTLGECAQYGVSRATLIDAIHRGLLLAARVPSPRRPGYKYLVRREDLLAYLAQWAHRRAGRTPSAETLRRCFAVVAQVERGETWPSERDASTRGPR
jgi:hypothetical protein